MCQSKDITEELEFVCEFYKDDLNPATLNAQLQMLGVEFQHTHGSQGTKSTSIDI